MTANKVKHESKTILDLSREKLSKNKVIRLLRETEVVCSKKEQGIYIDNNVKIGMYNIKLVLNEGAAKCPNPNRLSNYGEFGIRLYESSRDGLKEINIVKNENFKFHDWAKRSDFELRIPDLVDAILYCKRLDKLSLFN